MYVLLIKVLNSTPFLTQTAAKVAVYYIKKQYKNTLYFILFNNISIYDTKKIYFRPKVHRIENQFGQGA